MHVPLLDLQAQYRPLRDEILAAIARVCDSQRFIGGPEVDALERELAAYLGVGARRRRLVGHRRAARRADGARHRPGRRGHHARRSRSSRPPAAISRLGATPRLVDIDPRDLQHRSRPRSRAAITPRTRAIIPVHLYGLCADMDPLLAMRGGAGMPVIEDAAQAIGATLQGAAGWIDGRDRLLLVLPEQEPRRVRRRRARHDRRRGARARRPAAAQPRRRAEVLPQARSAATSGSMRCRPPSCGSSCRTWRAGPTRRRANADRYDALFARARPGRVLTLPAEPAGRTTSSISTSSACRSAIACARASTQARDRHRDLLSGAVSPAGVFRVARLSRGGFPARRSRGARNARAADLSASSPRRNSARWSAPWPTPWSDRAHSRDGRSRPARKRHRRCLFVQELMSFRSIARRLTSPIQAPCRLRSRASGRTRRGVERSARPIVHEERARLSPSA